MTKAETEKLDQVLDTLKDLAERNPHVCVQVENVHQLQTAIELQISGLKVVIDSLRETRETVYGTKDESGLTIKVAKLMQLYNAAGWLLGILGTSLIVALLALILKP
jgi:hypothetical protein